VGFQQSGENVTGIGPVLKDVFPVPEAAIINDGSDGNPPLSNLAFRGEIVYSLVGRRDHPIAPLALIDYGQKYSEPRYECDWWYCILFHPVV
jgi:hypothetical protein